MKGQGGTGNVACANGPVLMHGNKSSSGAGKL